MAIGDRRLVQRQHRCLNLVALVELLNVGGHDRACLAQLVPHLEPIGDIRRVEGDLPLSRVERLAALAQIVFEEWFGPGSVGRTVKAAANAGKKLSPGVSGPDFFSQH